MIRRPPRSTRTDTLFPYTTLFRSAPVGGWPALASDLAGAVQIESPKPARNCLGDVKHIFLRRQSNAIWRSEEHTSELQSLMRISYAVFCLKKKKQKKAK